MIAVERIFHCFLRWASRMKSGVSIHCWLQRLKVFLCMFCEAVALMMMLMLWSMSEILVACQKSEKWIARIKIHDITHCRDVSLKTINFNLMMMIEVKSGDQQRESNVSIRTNIFKWKCVNPSGSNTKLSCKSYNSWAISVWIKAINQ